MKVTIGSHTAEVESIFSDLVKCDSDSLEPASNDLSAKKGVPEVFTQNDSRPGAFGKAFGLEAPETVSRARTTITDAALQKLFFAPADFRDAEPMPPHTTPALAKRSSSSSSWDEELFQGDQPLSKSAAVDTDLYAQRPSPFLYVRVDDNAAVKTGAPLAKGALQSQMYDLLEKCRPDCIGNEAELMEAAVKALDSSALCELVQGVVKRMKENNQKMREQIQRAAC